MQQALHKLRYTSTLENYWQEMFNKLSKEQREYIQIKKFKIRNECKITML